VKRAPGVPEKRCPVCGALYNLQPCSRVTHAGHEGRKAERREIIERIRRESASRPDFPHGTEKKLLRDLADVLEEKGNNA